MTYISAQWFPRTTEKVVVVAKSIVTSIVMSMTMVVGATSGRCVIVSIFFAWVVLRVSSVSEALVVVVVVVVVVGVVLPGVSTSFSGKARCD